MDSMYCKYANVYVMLEVNQVRHDGPFDRKKARDMKDDAVCLTLVVATSRSID